MQSLRLVDGDLVFEHGELALVEGEADQTQCVSITLATNKGEWFLDLEKGIDFNVFLGKNLSEEEMVEELREGIHQNDFIASVENISITQDRSSRKQLITFVATTTAGELIRGEATMGAG
jgi:hypothetical protein